VKGIKLLTRADDAGLNTTVNKAIRSSVKQGIVRNISLLAAAPAIDHAMECFGDLTGEVDFGLQLCFISEWENVRWGPVAGAAGVATIVRRDGTFAYNPSELKALAPDIADLLAEAEAQYEKLTSLGFELTYVTGHDDYSGIPGLKEKVSAFAKGKKLVDDLNVSVSPLPGWPGPAEHPGTELADHLATTQIGTYLLDGHPAFKTEEIEFLKRPGEPRGEALLSRNRQRRMFADIEIVDYCENVGIELVRYSSFRT
jgi:predicted glycoside hydrolase/deacetylase ChbG (UPF0249 family)